MSEYDGFYYAMRTRGFSKNTMRSIRKIRCPRCGFEFSLVYARTFACAGCPEAVLGCEKIRCAKCDFEFLLVDTPEVHGEGDARDLAGHIMKVVKDYDDAYGIDPRR